MISKRRHICHVLYLEFKNNYDLSTHSTSEKAVVALPDFPDLLYQLLAIPWMPIQILSFEFQSLKGLHPFCVILLHTPVKEHSFTDI